MIKFVDYQTEPNLSFYSEKKDLINNDSSFGSLILSAIDLQCLVFLLKSLCWMSVFVCKRHFWWRQIWRHLHETMLWRWATFLMVYFTEVPGCFAPKIMKLCPNLSVIPKILCPLFFWTRCRKHQKGIKFLCHITMSADDDIVLMESKHDTLALYHESLLFCRHGLIWWLHTCVFTARCTLVQSAVLRLHVVWLYVCVSVCNVTGSGSHRLEILKTKCTDN